MSDIKAIDCDVHPTVVGHQAAAAASRRILARLGRGARHRLARDPRAIRRTRRSPRGRTGAARTATRRRPRRSLRSQVLDSWDASYAICNCLYGVQLVYNEDMARAFHRALNDWIAKEWLDRDPRLRASIVVPMQNVEYAVDEIERCAKDKRFVQIMVLAMQEMPLGRRHHWPIYRGGRAPRPADRHPCGLELPPSGDLARLAVALCRGLHQPGAGLSERRSTSLITEGVFAKYPEAEGRADRVRRDLAARLPVAVLEILARRCAPRSPGSTARRPKSCATISASPSSRSTARPIRTTSSASSSICDPTICCCFPRIFRTGSSTATTRMPKGIPEGLRRKILVENPLATYDRLNASPAKESAQ